MSVGVEKRGKAENIFVIEFMQFLKLKKFTEFTHAKFPITSPVKVKRLNSNKEEQRKGR